MFESVLLNIVVISILSLSFIGYALDKLVLSSRMDEWRQGAKELKEQLAVPGARDLAQKANQIFCGLFDAIYGEKHFSLRRIWASVLSSSIALLVIIFIIGYEKTLFPFFVKDVFGSGIDWLRLILYLVAGAIITFIPDFISLIETRWVLGYSKKKGAIGVFLLLIADILLTALIFFVGYSFMYLFETYVLLIFYSNELYKTEYWEYMSFIIRVDKSLPFFLTTFVTSLFWLIYVLAFGFIWLFHRATPLANFIFDEIALSKKPATSLVGYINFSIIFAYGLYLVF